MKNLLILLIGVITVSAQSVYRPTLQRVYVTEPQTVCLEFSGVAPGRVIQVDRRVNGLREKRFFVNTSLLGRIHTNGQPEFFQWFDREQKTLNVIYSYRIRCVDGPRSGWSAEVEAPVGWTNATALQSPRYSNWTTNYSLELLCTTNGLENGGTLHP